MCTTKLISKTDSNDRPLDKNIAGKQDFLFPKAEGFEYVEMLHLVYEILIYFTHGKLKFDTTDSTMKILFSIQSKYFRLVCDMLARSL